MLFLINCKICALQGICWKEGKALNRKSMCVEEAVNELIFMLCNINKTGHETSALLIDTGAKDTGFFMGGFCYMSFCKETSTMINDSIIIYHSSIACHKLFGINLIERY